MEKYLKLLKQSQLFRNVEEKEILSLLKCIAYKIVNYTNKQNVFYEGDTIDKIGIVVNGSVHIVQDDFWGNRSIIAHITPCNLFGEVFAFTKNKSLTVSVITAEPSEIIFFDFKKLITVCHSACDFHNRIIRNLLEIVAEKNIFITRKVQYLSKKTIREKLLFYLSDECKKQGERDFTIPFNRQQLADYLNVDRSALSNELSKMSKEGAIDYHKNVFRLKNDVIK
ncbi:MAG: Crp/Fnr family transcriptional regulator [Christensenellales bacterium]|jgi:CRP-like cAMP-binding protein